MFAQNSFPAIDTLFIYYNMHLCLLVSVVIRPKIYSSNFKRN